MPIILFIIYKKMNYLDKLRIQYILKKIFDVIKKINHLKL